MIAAADDEEMTMKVANARVDVDEMTIRNDRQVDASEVIETKIETKIETETETESASDLRVIESADHEAKAPTELQLQRGNVGFSVPMLATHERAKGRENRTQNKWHKLRGAQHASTT
jgi:hypothetical protein